MRILFYNWVDYRDAEGRGGGVSLYQRNLIAALGARGEVETAFLSAGLAHDLTRRTPHVVTLDAGPSPRYALVNSGLIAPSHADFAGTAQLDHAATEGAFAAFVDRTGPWDVIHFNNLEGLPAQVLSLRPRWPQTRFVLSLHNYYPFCPQVNLWFAERETCTDFHGGAKCARCLPAPQQPRPVRLAYAFAWSLSRRGLGPGTVFYDRLFRPCMSHAWRLARRVLKRRRGLEKAAPPPTIGHKPPGHSGEPFARRRARMVALINAHCDAVLCVSDRVRQIALSHGIHAERLQTRYIGSAEAALWRTSQPRPRFLAPDGTLHLAYLGYMRRDKGFHFLMRALAALPEPQARRIRLTVAARTGDAEAMAGLAALRPRLAEVRHVDGYTHADLPALLADVALGIVPAQWEDNLPQVALEMHARHIPLITSDRGGAQELGRAPGFIFRAEEAQDLHRLLRRVLEGALQPADYWARARPPTGMAEHLDALLGIYAGESTPARSRRTKGA